MAKAQCEEILSCTASSLWAVVTDYESYPQFVQGCQDVKIQSQSAQSFKVWYEIRVASQKMTYILNHVHQESEGLITWSLEESSFFKKNHGFWKIRSLEDQKRSHVTYQVDMEFLIPVPSFLLNRIIKNGLPDMVACFQNRVQLLNVKSAS